MQYSLQTLSQLKPLIQGFRKKAGLTQAAMAEKIGVSQQSYAQMESNLATTSVERLYTILRLLNVQLHLTEAAEPTQPYTFIHKPRTRIAVHAPSSVDSKYVADTALKKNRPPRITRITSHKDTSQARTDQSQPALPTFQAPKRGTTTSKPRSKSAIGPAPPKISKRSDTTKW